MCRGICFCAWQPTKAHFLDMVWPFLHCFQHTHIRKTWLQHCFSVRRACTVCRVKGGLWCNQYHISAVSLWALILSGTVDWLPTAFAIPLFSPTSPISSSFAPTLPITTLPSSVCLPSTPFLLFFSHLPCSSSYFSCFHLSRHLSSS